MKTFGLKRKGFNSFWLGTFEFITVQAWREIVKFKLYISRMVGFNIER